eukprot:jgi/Ulvmu1/10291/UM060_0093.1
MSERGTAWCRSTASTSRQPQRPPPRARPVTRRLFVQHGAILSAASRSSVAARLNAPERCSGAETAVRQE